MATRQFRILFREFLFRVVDLEILAPKGDMSKLLGQFAALLIVLSLWLSILPGAAGASSASELGLFVSWMVEHFLISTTMLVVGLFAVLSWESLLPDRRDVMILAPLPVRARMLFAAKVAAVGSALGITVAAFNLFTGMAAGFGFASAPAMSRPEFDAAIAPINAADLEPILNRDLGPAYQPGGALAPDTHAGVSIGVWKNGVRRIFSYGTAQPDSIFEIGSITKTFTALILAEMAEKGKVRLDQPVRELLPAGIVGVPRGPEITLLDLAIQHSGLPRMPDNFNPANPSNPYADYHSANLYSYIAGRGLAKPANAKFLYSNLGFALLGQALAVRAGLSYADLLKQQVTGPLGITDTAIALSHEQWERFIQGHDGAHRPVRPWDLDAFAGAGAIRSTAGDMLTYLEAQLDPAKLGPGTLSSAIRKTHEPRAEGFSGSQIGLAWFYKAETGEYSHAGDTGGYSSYAVFNPAKGYAAVVLVNTQTITGFRDALGQHITQRLSGAPAISLASPIVSRRATILSVLRSFIAYWTTMLAAGAFIFCCLLTIQGAAQLLPRQKFLRASAVLQISAFIVLLTGYFLQPAFTGLDDLAANQSLITWIPSYWFFAVFQQLNNGLPPPLAFLAHRGWNGLAASFCGAVAAYLICYYRTLRLIPEQPDILRVR